MWTGARGLTGEPWRLAQPSSQRLEGTLAAEERICLAAPSLVYGSDCLSAFSVWYRSDGRPARV